MRVLVVDDSPMDLKIVERLISRSGESFQVIAVDGGRKAMEVLGMTSGKAESSPNEQKIDIILTDYCMPEMTGHDLLKAVKDNSYSRYIPVVVMSSENNPRRIASCRAIGAEDFLLKPLKMNDVQKLRTYALSRAPASAPKVAATKRKLQLDLMVESSGSERRPCLAGVAVA